MQFTTSALLAALAVTVSAAPSLEVRQNGVSCQTSSNSPKTVDVTDVINQISGRGSDAVCDNTNGEDTDCTSVAHSGTALLFICGATNTGTTCDDVANFANQIQQDCQQGVGGDNLVGGTYTISPDLRVEVIHT